MLTAAVILVPLVIAVVVTLWSLDQVRYRPKRRKAPAPPDTAAPPPERPDGERL
jgi:hypothetical protein